MTFVEDHHLDSSAHPQANFPCFHPKSENATKHLHFVWEKVLSNVVEQNPKVQFFWVGHVEGCQDIINLINKEDTAARHTRGIVFLDFWINNINDLVGSTQYVKDHFFDGTFERWSIKPLYSNNSNNTSTKNDAIGMNGAKSKNKDNLKENSDRVVFSRLKQILPVEECSIYCLLGCSENYRYTPIRAQRYFLEWMFARSNLKEIKNVGGVRGLHTIMDEVSSSSSRSGRRKRKSGLGRSGLQGMKEFESELKSQAIDEKIERNLAINQAAIDLAKTHGDISAMLQEAEGSFVFYSCILFCFVFFRSGAILKCAV